MIEYDKWSVVYEDSELMVKRNPAGEEEYGVFATTLKGSLLILPRGTLEDIARTDREKGIRKINSLSPYYLTELSQYMGLNGDSILAAIKTAYIYENERMDEEIEKRDLNP